MSAPPDLAHPFFIGLIVALAAGFGIRLTQRWHGAFSLDGMTGPQKFHHLPTSRIGGLAVLAGVWAAASVSAPPIRDLLFAVGASAVPAFVAGMIEDVTKRTRPVFRLGATMLSGLIFCILTGYALTRVEVAFVDQLMAFPLVAIAFTSFAMGGLAHAVNIIDGFHGQATGAAILMLIAFAIVAAEAGDHDMALLCLIMVGVLSGFLLINFPFGYLFLGDGGAYFVGIMLAVVAVMIPMRNPDISPWISIAVLAYPLLETWVSIIRKIRRGTSPFDPDRLHLHMLVHRRFGKMIAKRVGNERLANPVTGALMWGGPLTSLVLITLIAPDREWSLLACALLLALYMLAYRMAVRRSPWAVFRDERALETR